MGLDSGQSIQVYCAGYYYRTGTLAVHIYMNRILLAKFQAMSPSTLDSSTNERSHLAAVLYAALFLDSFGLLDADAYKRDNLTVDFCVAHKGIYNLAMGGSLVVEHWSIYIVVQFRIDRSPKVGGSNPPPLTFQLFFLSQ